MNQQERLYTALQQEGLIDVDFNQFSSSQTQGPLDGFDKTDPSVKRDYSFVIWAVCLVYRFISLNRIHLN